MAPIAISIGISLGVALASNVLLSLLTPTQKVEGQRLNDLSAPKSQWGAQIPFVWGSMRLTANIIWADDIREVVTKKRQGGKGGPKIESTEYTYFASMAALLCRGPIVGIKRLWLNSKLVVNLGSDADAETLANSKKFMSDYVRVYPGTETQMPDPSIQGKEGIDNTPAHRGTAYLVLDNLPLADYGNSFPVISVEVVQTGTIVVNGAVTGGAVALAQVIDEVCGAVGFLAGELDTQELAVSVKHFWINAASAATEHLSILRQAYFFDVLETGVGGGRLKFVNQKRPGVVQAIPLNHLGCYEAGQTAPDYFEEIRTQELELPRTVSITHPDPNVEYREGVQMSPIKGGTNSQNDEAISLLVGLSASEAKTIADKQLFLAWVRRRKFMFSGCLQQALLEPSDVISAPFRGGPNNLCGLTRVKVGANFLVEMEALAYDRDIFDHRAIVKQPYTEAWTGVRGQTHQLLHGPVLEWVELTNDDGSTVYRKGTDYTLNLEAGTVMVLSAGIENNSIVRANFYAEESTPAAVIGAPGNTDLRILDIPLINDQDREYGIYVAATGGPYWRNGTLYGARMLSGFFSDFQLLFNILTKSVIGSCSSILGAASVYTVDYSNTLVVNLPYGELESFGLDSVLAGVNTAIVGGEIIRFCTAVLIAPKTYRLSGLVRGARGTEWAIGQHQAAEQFVLLTAYLNEVEGKVTDVGSTVSFKALTTGQAEEDVTPTSKAIVPVRLKPYAPVILKAVRTTGDVEIAWSRRDRRGGESQLFDTKPLSEDIERYEVQVWSAGVIASTVVVNQAQQVSLPSVPVGATIKVCQVSAKVGKGYFAEVTV